MAQNTQEENKAIYLDPFRYNQFQGFNSHNHIVVTEVGEGTSVVEVEMTQDAMNPLGMAHGGLIFSMCDVATGVAARTGGRITVKIWQGEYKAFIEIIDQGRGIPPEDLENVKTKFYKGSNSVRGSGIGLALVDSIMTALDGTLDIKSTLGRGTVVTLGLPLYHKA